MKKSIKKKTRIATTRIQFLNPLPSRNALKNNAKKYSSKKYFFLIEKKY